MEIHWRHSKRLLWFIDEERVGIVEKNEAEDATGKILKEFKSPSISIGMGLRAATSDRVLIVYGDLVFNNEAIKNLKLENSCIAIEQSYMSDEEVGCNISDGFVEQLLPDIPNKWAQIMFLMDKELDIFRKVSWDKNKSQYFGFEAINETIEKGGRFKSCTPNKAKITDVDSSKDLNMARKMLCS